MASAGLPPSPSWRSVLHPNRHLGRSNQYRYREEPDRHDQHPNVAFASSLHYNGTGGDLAVGGDTTGVGANQWPTLIVPLNQMSFWRRHEEQQQSHTDKSPSSEVFPFGVARSNVTATATAARWSNSSSVHHQTTKQSSPPFLTLALVKLTEVLPIYFQHLANPTIANASKACAVLDGIVATASSPTNSPKRTVHQPERSKQKNQNKNTKNSHERRRRMATAITLANNPTSPLTLQYWMSSSSSLASSKQFQQQTPTAMALESEWEALIAPFILLVAAETMAADLEHLRAAADMLPNMDDDPKNIISITATMTMSQNEPSNSATSASILGGLYQLVNRDLMHLHDILCEPFLRVSSNDKNSGTSRSGDPLHLHTEAALLLASGLKLAMEIGNVRCQLIDLQAGIFGLSKSISADPLLPLILNHTQDVTAIERDRPTLSEAATAVTLFIQAIEQAATVSTPDDETGLHNGSTSPTPNGRCKVQSLLQPMTKALIEELQAWKYCFATCAALERCE